MEKQQECILLEAELTKCTISCDYNHAVVPSMSFLFSKLRKARFPHLWFDRQFCIILQYQYLSIFIDTNKIFWGAEAEQRPSRLPPQVVFATPNKSGPSQLRNNAKRGPRSVLWGQIIIAKTNETNWPDVSVAVWPEAFATWLTYGTGSCSRFILYLISIWCHELMETQTHPLEFNNWGRS